MLKKLVTIRHWLLLAWFLVNITGCQVPSVSSEYNETSYLSYSTFTDNDGWQIWQFDLNNKKAKQLTWSANEAYYPSWGPSGELAYSDHNGKIWLLNSNLGLKNQQPKLISTLPKYCGHPAISPDGKHLVCVCFKFVNRSEESDLYLVDLESGSSERLVSLPGLQKYPVWSPDNKQLVFSSGYRKLGEQIIEQLWIMDFVNKIPVKIVDNGHSNINPVWSPDGQYIAYSSDFNSSLDIWLYNIEARQTTPVTRHPALESDPVWRLDGSGLIYLSTREGSLGLWGIDLSSKQENKLLLLTEDIHEPIWQKEQ